MPKNNIIYTLVSVVLLAIAVIMYSTILLKRDLYKELFSRGALYLIFALFLFWLFAIINYVQQHKQNIQEIIRSHRNGILITLLITSVIFISVQPMFRVLSDETNLLAVSKSMVYEKRADNVTMGKWYYDNFYPMNREAEKRPLLFPFLASLVHTVLGYRPENVFILNFIVLFAFLASVYIFIKNKLGELWSFASVVLVASQPIVSQCATSGGFDLLASLFLLISFIALRAFYREPSAIRLQLLWFCLLMYANIRYEGVVALVISAFYLGASGSLKREYFKSHNLVGYAATPLLMLPLFMQRLLVDIRLQIPANAATFSLENFIVNNLTVLRSLFDFRFYLPYATLVNLLGLIGLIYAMYKYFMHPATEDNSRHLYRVGGLVIVAYWVFYTSYYYGKIDHPTSARYYLFFYSMLPISAALTLSRFKSLRQKPVYAALLSVLMFILYHPVSIEDRFSRTQLLPREYRFTLETLKHEVGDSKRFIIVADRPGQYTVHNYGAVNFSYANSNYGSLVEAINNHLVERIYVVQDILYETKQPRKETELDKKIKLEKIAESQNSGRLFTRISKVII